MRKIYFLLFIFVGYLVNAQNIQPNINEYNQKLNSNNISFTENKGQVYDQNYKPRPDVLYGAMAGNMAVHIKNNGVSYQLYRVDKYKEVEDERTKIKRKEIDEQTIYRIDLEWLGANKNFTQTTDEELPGYNNYYLESCPNGALNVKSYTGITLNNLYNGINLHYYQKEGNLKYDYIVAPHANYKQIQIQVKGADVSLNKDGSLTLTTPLGKVKEGEPIVFQRGKQLKARWILRHAERSRSVNNEKSSTLSFEVENYNENYELLIDPFISRVWGTYYGSAGDDVANFCKADAVNNVYISGYTTSSTSALIATFGVHQTVYGGGNTDACLVKFNHIGVRLWGTYYGGSGEDEGANCSTEYSGNIFLAGRTTSNSGTVIATFGAHQTIYGGGTVDAFLVKFDSNGVRLWGTYYGGNADDRASCNSDNSGNVYLIGSTSSIAGIGTVIATFGAHQTNIGGLSDAFLVKFNSSGIRQWSTYYGGPTDEYGVACNTDALGNLYIVGSAGSNSGTIIATLGAHQTNYGGGNYDAFLVKFNSAGVRQWGTYYGAGGTEYVFSSSIDFFGNIYLTGQTDSGTSSLIATAGSHQTTKNAYEDAFLVKFNSSGVRLWGTYYGGTGHDRGNSCSTDASGNVYLSGNTSSNIGNFIATTGVHQTIHGGGDDAFLVKFNALGMRQWGTYYGDTGPDSGQSCTIDISGNVYLAGATALSTNSVIATNGAHQDTYINGGYDAFLVKFKDCSTLTLTVLSSNLICLGQSATLTASGASTYTWDNGSNNTNEVVSPTITTNYTVTGTDAQGCSASAVITQSVDACLGINGLRIKDEGLKIYPNPTNGIISISFQASTPLSLTTIEILNSIGQVLESEKTKEQNLSSDSYRINISNYPAGIYFVKATIAGHSRVVKVVKE